MAKTYTVKWGDTLWEIAQEHLPSMDTQTAVNKLAKINNIRLTTKNGKQYAYIVVGQVIKLTDDGSTSATKITSQKVKINTYGLQSGSTRGMYVTWAWGKTNTKEYKVQWSEYYDGYWHHTDSTTTYKYSEFSAKEQATSVKVKILPVSKTYKNSKDKEVAYWTNVSWMSSSAYSFSNNPPLEPSKPTVEIDPNSPTKLIASLDGLSGLNATIIEFQLSKNETPTSTKQKIKISGVGSAKAEFTIEVGGNEYRVRARGVRSTLTSGWSEWSDKKATVPAAPELTSCVEGTEDNTFEVSWTSVKSAESYELKFATKQEYFDVPAEEQPYSYELTEDMIKNCKAIVKSDKITSETNYYFRIRAKNSVGDSAWSNILYSNTGDGPLAPTTRSTENAIEVGETVQLQWTHNSTSSKPAKYSQIDMYVDGSRKLIPTISHGDETSKDKTYNIFTSAETEDGNDTTYDIICPNGAIVQWRVRTAGEDGLLGDWSVMRTIYIYAKPVLTLTAYDSQDNTLADPFQLTAFPLKLNGTTEAGENQKVIGYHISITADKTHQIVNNFGETVTVYADDVVYEQSYNPIDGSNSMDFIISAGDVSFATDVSYTIVCTVTMDSGLSAQSQMTFSSLLAKTEYILDAEISIDTDNYSATIRPYCTDSAGKNPIDNMYLYVYRREYNGDFTLISGDIDNASEFSQTSGGSVLALSNTFVTDPHPALDYARYRIVGVDKTTDATVYTDLPAYPVGCKSAIIQWDETWSDFDATGVNDEDGPSWSGEMLKLPYNIDVTYKSNPDVALINYIGRDHPVDYYGTQRGETATWSVVVQKDDQETMYALHRLSRWLGSVYVREPSGIGYWANVTVSFSRKHKDLTVPVTLSITRVEGGK